MMPTLHRCTFVAEDEGSGSLLALLTRTWVNPAHPMEPVCARVAAGPSACRPSLLGSSLLGAVNPPLPRPLQPRLLVGTQITGGGGGDLGPPGSGLTCHSPATPRAYTPHVRVLSTRLWCRRWGHVSWARLDRSTNGRSPPGPRAPGPPSDRLSAPVFCACCGVRPLP